MKYINVLTILFLFVSCVQVKQLEPFAHINDKVDTTKIHFDGFYTLVTNDKHLTSQDEVIFINGGKVNISSGGCANNEMLTCEFYKKIHKYEKANYEIGKFTIQGNEIYAFAPFLFRVRGNMPRAYMAHFKGVIKNKDTIINWRVVKPYPKKLEEWELNNNLNIHYLSPKTLFFVKTDAVKCIEIK